MKQAKVIPEEEVSGTSLQVIDTPKKDPCKEDVLDAMRKITRSLEMLADKVDKLLVEKKEPNVKRWW